MEKQREYHLWYPRIPFMISRISRYHKLEKKWKERTKKKYTANFHLQSLPLKIFFENSHLGPQNSWAKSPKEREPHSSLPSSTLPAGPLEALDCDPGLCSFNYFSAFSPLGDPWGGKKISWPELYLFFSWIPGFPYFQIHHKKYLKFTGTKIFIVPKKLIKKTFMTILYLEVRVFMVE